MAQIDKLVEDWQKTLSSILTESWEYSMIGSYPPNPLEGLLRSPYRIHDEIVYEVQRVQKDPPKITDKGFSEIIL